LIILGYAIPKTPVVQSSGPGGLEYNHSVVIKTGYGQGKYWIYGSDSPKPNSTRSLF